jgi:hypothetical protein
VDNTYPIVITVDNVTYNFTQESLTNIIKENESRRESVILLQDEVTQAFKVLANTREKVYDFFNERHNSGDTEITAEVSDVNDLLESISADRLRNIYSATVTITITVDDIEAVDDDEVYDIINDEINVEVGSCSVTVDDISVNHTYER